MVNLKKDGPAVCAGGEAHGHEANSRNLKTPSCLFHSPKCRGSFQHLLNVVRNASQYKFVTKEHLTKIAGAICTCQRFGFHERLDEDLVVSNHPNVLLELKSHLAASGCTDIIAALEKLEAIKVSGNNREKDLSYQRLIHILDLATRKVHWPLEYSRHDDDDVSDVKDSALENPYITTFNIDGISHYLRFLFGKGGKNIKQFAKKHKCVIKVVDSKKYCGMVPTSTFEVSCSNVGQGKVVEDDLRKLVNEIQSKREAHDRKVLAYWEERRRKGAERRRLAGFNRARTASALAALDNLKENAKNNYSTKYRHMLKEKSLRKLDKSQPKPTLLEEGNTWCANCLMAYDKDVEVECKYHRGYIQKRYWTCCSMEMKDSSKENQMEQHKVSGCATSRHIWKPHKKASVRKQSGDKKLVNDKVSLNMTS